MSVDLSLINSLKCLNEAFVCFLDPLEGKFVCFWWEWASDYCWPL